MIDHIKRRLADCDEAELRELARHLSRLGIVEHHETVPDVYRYAIRRRRGDWYSNTRAKHGIKWTSEPRLYDSHALAATALRQAKDWAQRHWIAYHGARASMEVSMQRIEEIKAQAVKPFEDAEIVRLAVVVDLVFDEGEPA